jgi:hypothetical protein
MCIFTTHPFFVGLISSSSLIRQQLMTTLSSVRVSEKILAYRPRDGDEPQYLVRFRGLGSAYSAWRTKEEVGNSALVHQYRKSAKIEEPSSSPSAPPVSLVEMALGLGGGSSSPKRESKESKNEVTTQHHAAPHSACSFSFVLLMLG